MKKLIIIVVILLISIPNIAKPPKKKRNNPIHLAPKAKFESIDKNTYSFEVDNVPGEWNARGSSKLSISTATDRI